MKKLFHIVFLTLCFFNLTSQISVTPGLSPTYLVDSVLLGPGVVAFNIQYTGAAQARGFFNGINSNIGLKSGVILSTGKATDAIGPNNTTSVTSINGTPGSPQLTQIIGQPTNDAAILEFDFIPSSDTVKFRYVFASEEYYEGVCTPYNDAFAFLINGPGITGTTNIALIPGTNKAVSISSVNGGVLGDPIYGPSTTYTYCNLTYTNYYVDNTTPPGPTVQYDGFTKVFTAKTKVIPCMIYHIKLAIADGGNDNTWDSAVFLEAGSFNTHYLTVDNHPLYTGCVINSAITEGSGNAIVSLKRYDSIPYPRTLNYTISGTASPADYSITPNTIHFNPGSDSTGIIITPLTDNITEGIETVSITIIPDFIVCTGWTIPGGQIKITDPIKLTPSFTSVTQSGCEPFCVQFNNTTTITTTANWNFGDGSPTVNSPSASYCYTAAGTYDVKLVVSLNGSCKDSITKLNYVKVYDKPVADFIQKSPTLTVNDNKGVFLNASINGNTYKWFLENNYISSAKDLTHEFVDTGCYVLKLVAISTHLCKDTAEKEICVLSGFNFWAPNTFSPNDDGLNDVFKPIGSDWKQGTYYLEITNRWGNIVFSTSDETKGWDGKSGGVITDDVYVWRVSVTDSYNRKHDLTGHILLMR